MGHNFYLQVTHEVCWLGQIKEHTDESGRDGRQKNVTQLRARGLDGRGVTIADINAKTPRDADEPQQRQDADRDAEGIRPMEILDGFDDAVILV